MAEGEICAEAISFWTSFTTNGREHGSVSKLRSSLMLFPSALVEKKNIVSKRCEQLCFAGAEKLSSELESWRGILAAVLMP